MRRRTVKDVMTKAVVSAYRGACFKDIVQVMIKRGITAMPVIDEGHRVAGVVSESDLLAKEEHKNGGKRRRLGRRRDRSWAKAQALTAEDLMSSPAITVHPEATIVEAARLLDAHRIKRMPVTDDQNRLVGIVSRRDLLSVFTRTDEEIRDEVRHEVFALADPTQVSVYVRHGVVTLGGTMRQKDLIPIVVRLAAATDGVVGVIDELNRDMAGAEP
ncbi:CBS domain-containing protein [Actinoallomurus sp. NBC_01490]|uniref:CBS domain-containing protein n=1 Tax=Actinoallomurus sp. NBC_01490 TaxID=2903557 RepID=UPI002E300BDC|nr:CBS domain-containing protein [Actinoallomurus sp. NBC_01490]